MAHLIMSVLCWLGLSSVLGNIVEIFDSTNDRDIGSFLFVMINGFGASLVFVPILGVVLAVLSWIIPSIEQGADYIFDILSPFGLPQD